MEENQSQSLSPIEATAIRGGLLHHLNELHDRIIHIEDVESLISVAAEAALIAGLVSAIAMQHLREEAGLPPQPDMRVFFPGG
jgi:hypothetical protein